MIENYLNQLDSTDFAIMTTLLKNYTAVATAKLRLSYLKGVNYYSNKYIIPECFYYNYILLYVVLYITLYLNRTSG